MNRINANDPKQVQGDFSRRPVKVDNGSTPHVEITAGMTIDKRVKLDLIEAGLEPSKENIDRRFRQYLRANEGRIPNLNHLVVGDHVIVPEIIPPIPGWTAPNVSVAIDPIKLPPEAAKPSESLAVEGANLDKKLDAVQNKMRSSGDKEQAPKFALSDLKQIQKRDPNRFDKALAARPELAKVWHEGAFDRSKYPAHSKLHIAEDGKASVLMPPDGTSQDLIAPISIADRIKQPALSEDKLGPDDVLKVARTATKEIKLKGGAGETLFHMPNGDLVLRRPDKGAYEFTWAGNTGNLSADQVDTEFKVLGDKADPTKFTLRVEGAQTETVLADLDKRRSSSIFAPPVVNTLTQAHNRDPIGFSQHIKKHPELEKVWKQLQAQKDLSDKIKDGRYPTNAKLSFSEAGDAIVRYKNELANATLLDADEVERLKLNLEAASKVGEEFFALKGPDGGVYLRDSGHPVRKYYRLPDGAVSSSTPPEARAKAWLSSTHEEKLAVNQAVSIQERIDKEPLPGEILGTSDAFNVVRLAQADPSCKVNIGGNRTLYKLPGGHLVVGDGSKFTWVGCVSSHPSPEITAQLVALKK